MKPEDQKLRFLLGANTPQGFVSRFEQLLDPQPGWRAYILKGGPGSGKSTLLGKVARAFAPEEEQLEYIHCASDIDSLDAVILPQRRVCVVDGTPPHALEPRHPGAVESLVDLSACWEDDKLAAQQEQIVAGTADVARCHDQCCRYLAAGGALLADSYRIALTCLNMPKLTGYLGRLGEKELKKPGSGSGKETVRFLTAVTNRGFVKYPETAKALAQRIYLIHDDFGAVSRLVLSSVRSKALAAGYDVIACYCPLAPYDKLEQLFIPQLSLGLMTSNRFHDFSQEINPYRIINCQRFTDQQQLREYKKRLSYNRKAATQLLEQAQELLAEAKSHHDKLEAIYTQATDHKKVDRLADALIKKIRG